MHFVPLGVGDAFSALHYSSCLAVHSTGEWLLVDCPHPIRKILREASLSSGQALDVDSFRAVVITHLHADHSSGLEGLGYFAHFVLGRKLDLVIHPSVLEELWSGHLAAGMRRLRREGSAAEHPMALEDYFRVVPLDEKSAVQVGPFAIECRRTWHHVPTTALRIAAPDGTLAYSADTAFDPALIAWLTEAELAIHETNYGVHTPYDRLAALPESTRRKLRLIHYPDGFDCEASVIEPLRQGRVYDVRATP